jgi:hypothetical protein
MASSSVLSPHHLLEPHSWLPTMSMSKTGQPRSHKALVPTLAAPDNMFTQFPNISCFPRTQLIQEKYSGRQVQAILRSPSSCGTKRSRESVFLTVFSLFPILPAPYLLGRRFRLFFRICHTWAQALRSVFIRGYINTSSKCFCFLTFVLTRSCKMLWWEALPAAILLVLVGLLEGTSAATTFSLKATETSPAPLVVPPSRLCTFEFEADPSSRKVSWLLGDGNDGPWSSFFLRAGTPPQTVRVLVSTANNQPLVVVDQGCGPTDPLDCGNSRGGLFQTNASST